MKWSMDVILAKINFLENTVMSEANRCKFCRFGEGNGNPLQCSCLENPRDRGAWWAAVYGVTQSRTQLKQLSSSSSINRYVTRNVENF